MNDSRLFGISVNLFSLIRWAVLLIILVAIVIVFVGVPLPVNGQSMEPNFHSGELVWVNKLGYSGKDAIKRFDVVAAKFPADPKHTRLIKRVIGLPGERVQLQNGQYIVDGKALDQSFKITPGTPPYVEISDITLGQDEYFLSGDNRPGSSDSRLWGQVQRDDIQGRVNAILWPLDQAKVIFND